MAKIDIKILPIIIQTNTTQTFQNKATEKC